MLIRILGVTRFTLRTGWFAAAATLVALIAVPHILGPLERTLFIVGSGNTHPTAPVGSALIVGQVLPASVEIGDTITFTGPGGALIFDRVTGIVGGETPGFTTAGFAKGVDGPLTVADGSVVGRVDHVVPVVGSMMTMLSSTGGAVGALAVLGGLLLLIWFTEEMVSSLKRTQPSTRRTALAEAAH
ncbi:MAG: hypothetical protein ACXWZR_17090 [Mycobacterium sp.]